MSIQYDRRGRSIYINHYFIIARTYRPKTRVNLDCLHLCRGQPKILLLLKLYKQKEFLFQNKICYDKYSFHKNK